MYKAGARCDDHVAWEYLAGFMKDKPYMCLDPACLRLRKPAQVERMSDTGLLHNNCLPENQVSIPHSLGHPPQS